MFKRITNLWKLSEYSPRERQYASFVGDTLENVGTGVELVRDDIGDGKAEFLPDMTESEYLDHIKDESGYWKKFTSRLGL